MILTSHQPDLLPWTGFFHKLWRADLMDLAIYDQFQSRGYQRRVGMREKWASLPVGNPPVETKISEVRIAPGGPDKLIAMVRGRYQGSRYWNERGRMVIDWIEAAAGGDWRLVDQPGGELLWTFNMSLILQIRDWLGIDTPIAVAGPLKMVGIDGVIEMCSYYGGLAGSDGLTYLSGQGGRGYLGEDPEQRFAARGIDLTWSEHQADSGDSILTTIFDFKRPMDIVEQTHDVPPLSHDLEF